MRDIDKKLYKEVGRFRMKNRKEKRNEKYRSLVTKAIGDNISFSGQKWGSWADSNSPTGFSQICSYGVYGTCQSPCNGDC